MDTNNGKIDTNTKMGVNWSYLQTLLNIYEEMINQMAIFNRSRNVGSTINPVVAYSDFASCIFSFYIAVESQYMKYKKVIPYECFEKVVNPSNAKYPAELNRLCRSLNLWATSQGVFKTLTESINVNESW